VAAQVLAPAPQEKRLAAYLDWLAQAAGHADRNVPLRNYCTGLLLDGERKSVEPMAARLAPDNVQRVHESLHHFVAQSPWSDAAMLRQVRNYVLPAMEKKGPVTAWIVDETGFVKKGTHSVGVARQYCGRVGKTENCQVAVSLSVATATGSLPIAWRLYLPEEWANDPMRRAEADVPKQVQFQTKPEIALAQIRQAVEDGVAPGVVLADEVYGSSREFRDGVAKLKLDYSLAVRSTTTVWALERQPLPPKGAAGKLLHKESGDLNTQRCDRMRVMPLGANSASPAAGSGEVAGRRVAQDGRRGLRGKNGSFLLSRSRTPQYIAFRDGEIPASCGLRSDPTRVPV
jgi:SRSO17 transposase